MTGDDRIEALLRSTGRRPAVSAWRADRVRERARSEWQAEVARRRWQRRTIGALGVAAAVVLPVVAIAVFRGGDPGPEIVSVDRVTGTAWTERGPFGSRVPLTAPSGLPRGTTIVTASDARAALTVPTGHHLRLDNSGVLRVLSATSFALPRGAVYVDSGPEKATGPIRIDTPHGTIEDTGTQFEARIFATSMRVRVREGEVTIGTQAGPIRATAGQQITVNAKGEAELTQAIPGDWAWIESVAPTMAIDGRTLADFLTWVTRERGVGLRYADPQLEAKAATIKLSGSIDRMSLDQATASVLATSGLTYRWKPGELVVGDAAGVDAPHDRP